MKKMSMCLLLIIMAFSVRAQEDNNFAVHFLANDNISSVNIDQDVFIASLKPVLDQVKNDFKNLGATQKVAVLMTAHKTGKPTFAIYSKPQLKAEDEKRYLIQMNLLRIENTKLVDFPMLFTLNVDQNDEWLSTLDLPNKKAAKEYQAADLKTKYELNKAWAINEVLPVLIAYEVKVEDKFAGVKNFGKRMAQTNFADVQNIEALTSRNSDYWRACMEMNIGNQLIPATKMFALVSQGRFDEAVEYIKIAALFCDSVGVATFYLNQLQDRLGLFTEELNGAIQKGIAEHDKGAYQKAIDNYSHVLKSYPHSAWAMYEMYFSQNALEAAKTKVPLNKELWEKAKVNIYKADPLYHMDISATNGKEAYLLFRRKEIDELFKDKDAMANDIFKFADIAMDLGVYDFAAQQYWNCFTFNIKQKEALNKYLYCIEKLGVTNLKENFKGNYPEIFAQIEKDKDTEMKASAVYQSMKN